VLSDSNKPLSYGNLTVHRKPKSAYNSAMLALLRSIFVVATLAVVLIQGTATPAAQATTSGTGISAKPNWAPPTDAAPRLPNGKPDFSGVWDHQYVPDMTATNRNPALQKGPKELPFTSAGVENMKNYDPVRDGDYTGMCMPYGLMRSMTASTCCFVIGESTCYLMGRGSGPALHRWMKRQERRQQVYERVSSALHSRGGLILMTVRYIPGARMVATLTAGATRYSFKKFIVFTFFGVTIAYTYVALLGYLGGDAFAHDQLKGLAFSLGLAATVGLVVETTRRIVVKRRAVKITSA